MITSYNKFVNEGLLDSLKKMFSSLIANISDNLKKGVDDLEKSLDGTRGDQKKIKDLYKGYITNLKTELSKEIQNADLKTTKKVISDTIRALYTTINSVIKYADNSNLTLEIIFNNLPKETKKQFSFNNKNFEKYVDGYTNNLIKGYFNMETKFTEEELGLKEEAKKVQPTKEEVKKAEPTKEEVKPEDQKKQVDDTVKPEQAKTATTPGTESVNIKYTNKDFLFEAEEQVSGTTTVDPKKLKQYKDKVVKWFNGTCDQILNNVINSKTTNKASNVVNSIADDTLKVFNNKEGAKRIANRAVSAQPTADATKKKFRTIRDAMIKAGYGNKEDYGDV